MVTSSVNTTWRDGSKEYNTSADQTAKTFLTGYTKATKAADYAKITTKAAAAKAGTYGTVITFDDWGNGGPAQIAVSKLPFTRTVYVTAKTATWGQLFVQAPKNLSVINALYLVNNKKYTAGSSYSRTFNGGVFGPTITAASGNGLYRVDDTIFGYFGIFTDGAGHDGYSAYDKATTTLYRNGTKIATYAGSVDDVSFDVPKASASYKLVTSVTRSTTASVSSKIVSTWTFTSKHVDYAALPATVVRYAPTLTTANTSKAKTTVKVPVKIQGSAAGSNLKSLAVYYSVNGGSTWKKLTVSSGKVTLKNPAAGKGVSFKSNVKDKQGNTVSQVIYNAYFAK